MRVNVKNQGLDKAQDRMEQRVKRLRNLQPIMRVIGEEMVRETRKAFSAHRSPAGEEWPDLARSTKLARVRKRQAGRLVTKSGKRKKGRSLERALKLREAAFASGGLQPLRDTGRAINSIRVRTSARGLVLSMVGYLRPHITGSQKVQGQPPKRNPIPIELVSGRWQVIPRLARQHVTMIRRYVETGRVV